MLTLQTAANEKQKENMRKLKEQEAELLVSVILYNTLLYSLPVYVLYVMTNYTTNRLIL